MIEFESLGHINIVVDDMERATAFYGQAFGAVPLQDFPHFRNVGFARSAGFMEKPEEVDVTIRFLRLPTPEGLILELMEYHQPPGLVCSQDKVAHGLGCVGHIALRVRNIDETFAHLRATEGIRMMHPSPDYQPFKIDAIEPDEFKFFDETLEQNAAEKQNVCRIVGSIRYFYVIDPYGVQWEFEHGHTDIGSE